MSRKKHRQRFPRRAQRRGSSAIEVVMATGVMVPVAGALFLLGLRISATLYQVTAATVSWPFL